MTNYKSYILAAKPVADDDSDDTQDVELVNNSIFFYTGVSKHSVLNLNKNLKKASTDLVYTAHLLDIPVPEIKLHINSDGGSLLDGFAAVDYVRNSKAPVHSIIEGSAASAATLISVVAKKRSINKNSFMLIHQLSGGMWGKFESMKDDIQNCNVFMDKINEIYQAHTKIPKNTLKEILKRDIYFDAKTCLKYGLVDKIIE
jgi:ATP-dependent Clp endopeptidase proteolytic subunit ClpP